MSVRIGFGSADLWGSWQTDASLGDEIRVQAVVVTNEDGVVAALLESDLSLMWPEIALELRSKVAACLETDEDRVGVFCTQNHGVPFLARTQASFGDYTLVADRFCAAARLARERAVPCRMAYVESAPSPAGLVRRRKVFNECSAFTFWFGYEVAADGRADAAELMRRALAGLVRGQDIAGKHPGALARDAEPETMALPAVPAPFWMDEEADTLAQGLFFSTPDGEPIGTIVRWAAHPATATGIDATVGGDYPVYVRRRLVERFGGEALFLTGPCGDQAVPLASKSVAKAEQIGRLVADQLFDRLAHAEWRLLRTTGAVSAEWLLPLRRDVPADARSCKAAHAEAIRELHQRRKAGAPVTELKRLADRVETLSYWAEGSVQSWTGLTFEDLTRGECRHISFAMRLEDVVVLGLPGEPLGGYSRALRRSYPHISLVTAEECNGYLSYIPMAADCPLGGYEVCASVFDEAVEPVLLKQTGRLLRGLFPVDRDDTVRALTSLGIDAGETVLVHASIRALGQVAGGPKALVQTFLDHLGAAGTLAVPTFPADFFWGGSDQVWDRDNTPSAMGIITETVRTWPGAVRTAHAPHPLAAVGPAAKRLGACTNTRDFDETSPFQILLDLDAWIVLLGVDFGPCTFIHLVEEREQVPYRHWAKLEGTVIDGGRTERKQFDFYRRYEPYHNNFRACGREMEAAGLVHSARLGMGMVRAVRARELIAHVTERVRENPLYLLTAASREAFQDTLTPSQ